MNAWLEEGPKYQKLESPVSKHDLLICKYVFRYIADHIKTHDPWLPTRKLPRLLTTSASAIRKIQRMGELQVIRQTTINYFSLNTIHAQLIECNAKLSFIYIGNRH